MVAVFSTSKIKGKIEKIRGLDCCGKKSNSFLIQWAQ